MLKIKQTDHASIRRHGEEAYPNECCGVLLGRVTDDGTRIVRRGVYGGEARPQGVAEERGLPERHLLDERAHRIVTSTARCGNTRTDSAHNRYNIDPRDLVRIQREGRERGEDIIGFYHSHPDHPARWSPTDLAEAHWFGCSYLITSVEKGRAVLTNSFELTGNGESDKQLSDETIEII